MVEEADDELLSLGIDLAKDVPVLLEEFLQIILIVLGDARQDGCFLVLDKSLAERLERLIVNPWRGVLVFFGIVAFFAIVTWVHYFGDTVIYSGRGIFNFEKQLFITVLCVLFFYDGRIFVGVIGPIALFNQLFAGLDRDVLDRDVQVVFKGQHRLIR